MAKTILIVEDDPNISELVQMYLEKEGYNTRIASDGGQGLDLFRQLRPDLVLLDIMLPVMDGWSVLRTIRQDSKTPVIMLTAKGETNDKVQGLKQGADDYLTKPFEPEELLACVRTLLRRSGGQLQESDTLTWGDLSLERGTFTLSCNGRDVRLSRREYDLMELLMRNGAQVVTKEQLLIKVWGYDSQAEDNNVEVYISFLRRKLTHLHSQVRIKTLRMLGYCLTREVEA